MADSNWMERELCVMLWCHGWGSPPPFPKYPNVSPGLAEEGCSWEKHSTVQGLPGKGVRGSSTPLGEGSWVLWSCAGAASPSGQLLQLCFYLLALRILVQFNKPTNTWVWCSVTTTAEWALALQDPCLDPHISVWGKALPQALTATLHTCSSTYLLVSNLITIQSRGKTLIFIRFRNTQKIFRRNSCHTGKKK